MKTRRIVTALVAWASVGIACGSCSSTPAGTPAPKITETAPFSGHGSTTQAYELGAKPGQRLILANRAGSVVARGTADRLGSLLIRNLAPGSGYTFRSQVGSHVEGTKPFTVLSTSYIPPESLYTSQHLHVGLNYIRMRDGVSLAATVRLPPGKTLADGPFPTVIEYSGYQIAAPGNLIDAILNHQKLDNPLLPSTSTAVGAVIAPLLGFAAVSVQLRGSGCSGGAFDLFGPPTIADGYDMVEAIAHQPWVLHHKVGMVGISFSGFSQLFVAGARPPDLAAIAPMSVTNDFYDTGYPGGIFNNGFAASWISERFANSEPAPSPGALSYANALVAAGDKNCIAAQALHLQNFSLAHQLGVTVYRTPSLFDPRWAEQWAKRIDVPVFLAGAFQDEQTGGQWPEIIPDLKNDPNVWVTLINGTHVDSLNPAILSRWLEFLDIFVAGAVPTEPPIISAVGPQLYPAIADAPAEAFPPLRFTNATSVAQARALFEKDDPRVRVLFDNGWSSAGPGALGPVWEQDFSAWPPSQAVATREYLGPGGTLATSKVGSATVSFRPDPAARPRNDLPQGNAWAATPPYVWAPVTGSSGIGFISKPLTHDVVVVGPSALDLWVKSSVSDTDLQATISEVRPDGQEMYMTSGFLRASDRKLDPSLSSVLHPEPSYTKQDAAPLPKGRFTEIQIPLLPFAYAFRAGSRIRVTVEAPGGDRPSWEFATPETGGKVVDTVSLGGVEASSLVLPVIEGVTVPDTQPACPSLRGQPCRAYVAAGNGG